MIKNSKCVACGKPIGDEQTRCIDCTYSDLIGKQLAGLDMQPLTDGGLLEFDKDGGGAYVKKFLGGAEEIRVPETCELGSVYKIGKEAFADDGDIKRVYLPATVRIIEERAFADSTLEQIALPEGLTEIGKEAFDNTNLLCVPLPDTLNLLGDGAFRGTKNLTGIVVPEGVGIIPKNAFRDSKLESAVIVGATRIQSGAFKDCAKLQRLYLGDGLLVMEDDSISGTKIAKLIVPSTVTRVGSGNLNCGMHIAITGEGTSIELGDDDPKEFEATLFARQTSRAWAQARAVKLARRPLCEFKI